MRREQKRHRAAQMSGGSIAAPLSCVVADCGADSDGGGEGAPRTGCFFGPAKQFSWGEARMAVASPKTGRAVLDAKKIPEAGVRGA